MTVMKGIAGTAGALALLLAIQPAQAAIITTPNPSLSSESGARIRWGNTGFEAALFDSNSGGSTNLSPNLNPAGTPVWQLNTGYDFLLTFDSVTGTLGLSIDFDLDNSFSGAESISRSIFAAPGLTSYQGFGFKYLQISGNESGNARRSNLSNLIINGTPQASITPNGALLDTYYTDSGGNALGSIIIAGTLSFTTAGTGSDERPSWNFRFYSPEELPQEPVIIPEPGSLALAALGLLGLAVARRRRTA